VRRAAGRRYGGKEIEVVPRPATGTAGCRNLISYVLFLFREHLSDGSHFVAV